MHELTYTSQAKKNVSLKDLNDILKTANEFNKTHSITGCLVYHNGLFVQTLHGAKKGIFDLLKKIQGDERHTNVNLVWEGPAEKEVFKGWHMAFFSPKTSGKTSESLIDFERNLITLSTFYKADSASVRIFWSIVKDLCLNEAQTH
ncbi:BLUF domain-containing protein [Maribacter aurantiacus]|uniref:BLUF domain-containing protein n=1 Tax=Maribacter aurantiacus TaxID=1882343 RepID=A0A5R8MC22_9FLAO|nr:BLUF domain-containing protein [Maribacter aurantiacus]TLF47093.1 BLUF domain-containing protein [Maribacter aurantiacus]